MSVVERKMLVAVCCFVNRVCVFLYCRVLYVVKGGLNQRPLTFFSQSCSSPLSRKRICLLNFRNSRWSRFELGVDTLWFALADASSLMERPIAVPEVRLKTSRFSRPRYRASFVDKTASIAIHVTSRKSIGAKSYSSLFTLKHRNHSVKIFAQSLCALRAQLNWFKGRLLLIDSDKAISTL